MLFTLAAGQSTVLAETGGPSPPAAVAGTLADGSIGLDFGRVPPDQTVIFGDVLRMTSGGDAKAKVTLSLSGPVAAAVRRVGFWDDRHGVVTHGLSLAPGESAGIALELAAGTSFPSGAQSGSLSVTAELSDGSIQRCEVPVVLTVVPADVCPSASPSPDPYASSCPASTPVSLHPEDGLGRILSECLWRPVFLGVALLH